MISFATNRPVLTASALLGLGFTLQGCGGEGPDGVAEQFWHAAQARDAATVEALSIPSDNTTFNFENEESEIRSIEMGETSVEGDRAEVETDLDMRSGEKTLDVEFLTVLTRADDQWLVDMDETSSEIMKAVLGASMEEMGEAIGEGMKGAMEGVAEGLAEGMEAIGEAFEDAAANVKKDEAASGEGSSGR